MSWLVVFTSLLLIAYCAFPTVIIKRSEIAANYNIDISDEKAKYYYWTGILIFMVTLCILLTFDVTKKEESVQAVNIPIERNVKGINISNNDGHVNLESPAESGCEFVYLKATEGATFEDSYVGTYYKECKKLGLKVGAYHYLVSTSTPEEQAENFYKVISEYEWDLIPMLDVEVYFDGLDDYIERFKTAFNQLSPLKLGIYSYTSFINSHLNNADSEIYDMPLWEANYNGNPWSNVGNNKFKTLVGHQYSTEKHIGEYIGNFNGDINEFNSGCLIQ